MEDTLIKSPKYLINGNLYDEDGLRKAGWNDEQLSKLLKFHNIDGKDYDEQGLRQNGWLDQDFNKLYGKEIYKPKVIKPVAEGPEVDIRRNHDGQIEAKHKDAKEWKPISEWRETGKNLDFWNKVEKQANDVEPLPGDVGKKEKIEKFYEIERQLKEELRQAEEKQKNAIKASSNAFTPYYSAGDITSPELDKAKEKLDKFYQANQTALTTYEGTQKVMKNYEKEIPANQPKNIITASEIAKKYNTDYFKPHLSEPDKIVYDFNTEIEKNNEKIAEIEKNKTVETESSDINKIAILKGKNKVAQSKIQAVLNKQYGNDQQRLQLLYDKLKDTDLTPDEKKEVQRDIDLTNARRQAFIKSDGKPEQFNKYYAEEAIKTVPAEDILKLTDVIPANATPIQMFNIYAQALVEEAKSIEEKQTNGKAWEVITGIGLFGAEDEDLKRLKGPGGIYEQIKAIAPIVLLNKLPDDFSQKEGETKPEDSWGWQVLKGFLGTGEQTLKEGFRVLYPYAATDFDNTALSTDIQQVRAQIISDAVESLGLTNAVNAVDLEGVQDRAVNERWTPGWMGKFSGPTVGIIAPMAIGGLAYGGLTRLVPALRTLSAIAKGEKYAVEVAKDASKMAKLAGWGKNAMRSGLARNVELGLQYELGGRIFSGNKDVEDESDFLSGFFGGVGEGGVMILPKILENVYGKNGFTKLISKLAKTVKANPESKTIRRIGQAFDENIKTAGKLVGGGVGEMGEETWQTSYQLWRDTENYQDFKTQMKSQFGELEPALDFFAQTFFMGMMFRGAGEYGRIMEEKANNAWWGLDAKGKEKSKAIAQSIIKNQYNRERKAFLSLDYEFDDNNLSILYEDAKKGLEEAKAGKNEADIKEAQALVNKYAQETKRRKITEEHAKLKADLHDAKMAKEIYQNTQSKTPNPKKKAMFGVMIDKAIENMTIIEEKLNRSRAKLARENLHTLATEKKTALEEFDKNRDELSSLANEQKSLQAKIKRGNVAMEKAKAKELGLPESKTEKFTENKKRLEEVNTEIERIGKRQAVLGGELQKLTRKQGIEQRVVTDYFNSQRATKRINRLQTETAQLVTEKQGLEQEIKALDEEGGKDETIKQKTARLEAIDKKLEDINPSIEAGIDEKTGRVLHVPLPLNPKERTKALNEAGYEPVMQDGEDNSVGGEAKDEEGNQIGLNASEVNRGDILELEIIPRNKLTKEQKERTNIFGEKYSHFVSIKKNGKVVGRIKYKSAIFNRAISLSRAGYTPKIVVTGKRKLNLDIELVIPTGQRITNPTQFNITQAFDDEMNLIVNKGDKVARMAIPEPEYTSPWYNPNRPYNPRTDDRFVPEGDQEQVQFFNRTDKPMNSEQLKLTHSIGVLMSEMVNELTNASPFYRKIFKGLFFGITIDPENYGLYYKGQRSHAIFLNPSATLNSSPRGRAYDYINTIIHELTHAETIEEEQKSGHDHGDVFVQALKKLNSRLTETGIYDKYLAKLTQFCTDYHFQLNDLRNDYEKTNVRTVRESLEGLGQSIGNVGGSPRTLEQIQERQLRPEQYQRTDGNSERNQNNERLSRAERTIHGTDKFSREQVEQTIPIEKQTEDIQNNKTDIISNVAKQITLLFNSAPEIWSTRPDIFKFVKDAILNGTVDENGNVISQPSPYSEGLTALHFLDNYRSEIMKQSGLVWNKEKEEMFVVDNPEGVAFNQEAKLNSLMSIFRDFFDLMTKEGFDEPVEIIQNLFQREDAKNAFADEQSLNSFLQELAKEQPELAGLLSDRYILSAEELLSMKVFYGSTIKTREDAIDDIGSNVIEHKLSLAKKVRKLQKMIKEHLNNFAYNQYQDADPSKNINAVYNEFFIGENSRENQIKNNKEIPYEEKGAVYHEMYKEFLGIITGLDPNEFDGILKADKNYQESLTEGKYVLRPNIIKFMNVGTGSPIGKTNAAKLMFNYWNHKPKKGGALSNIANIITYTENDANFSITFNDVNMNRKNALEQDSGLALLIKNFVKKAIDNKWVNPIAEHYKKLNQQPILHRLNGMFNTKVKGNVTEAQYLTDKDLSFSMLYQFYNGEENTYKHWLGPFGGKTQLYFVKFPKYKNAEAIYTNLYNSITDEKVKDKLATPEELKSGNEELYQLAVDHRPAMPNIKSEEERKAFINDFVFNYALNSLYFNEMLNGNLSDYKDAITIVKRMGSANSPGMAPDTNIKNGVGKTHLHVISNDLHLFGNDAADGVQFVRRAYMEKYGNSIGGIFNRVKDLGIMNSAKMIFSDVINGRRALEKSNTIVIDDLAKAFPNSAYGKIFAYMEKYNIDTMSFESSTKKLNGGTPTLTLFPDGVNFKEVDLFSKKNQKYIANRSNAEMLYQQDLRHNVDPKLKKQPIQMIANFLQFRRSEEMARLWNEIQQITIKEIDDYYNQIGENGVDQKLIESSKSQRNPLFEYLRDRGREENPFFDRSIQSMRSSMITREVLRRRVNRLVLQEIPVMDVGLKPMRIVKGKVLLPEVNLNVTYLDKDGNSKYRYAKIFKSKERFLKELNDNKLYYEDLLDEYGNLNEWELEYLEDGQVKVPGEPVMITRVPAGGPHSHTLARLHEPIPGAGNVIMTDHISQQLAGADFDGDQRFVEFRFKQKLVDGKVNPWVSYYDNDKNTKEGLVNETMREIQREYQYPDNFELINTGINKNAYDKILEKVKKPRKYTINNPKDLIDMRRLNVSSNSIIGLIQNFATAYDFMKKHKIQFKERVFNSEKEAKRFGYHNITKRDKATTRVKATKAFAIDLIDINGNKKQIYINGFSIDKHSILKHHIDNLQNLALDNDKDPKIEFLGVTEEATGMFMSMLTAIPEIDKLSKEEQKTKAMEHIADVIAYFNSPLVKEFISLSRDTKGVKNTYTQGQIFQMLIGNGYSKTEVQQLQQLYYLSKEINDTVFSYINMTREMPKNSIQALSQQQARDKIELNQTKFIDSQPFIGSPFFEAVEKTFQLAKNHIFSKSLLSTDSMKNLINFFKNIKGDYLEDKHLELLVGKLNAAFLLEAFMGNRDIETIRKQLINYINSKVDEDNDFLDLVSANENGEITIDENLRGDKLSEENILLAKKAFDNLPQNIQELFMIYSVSKYGVNTSQYTGNYSHLFGNNIMFKIGERMHAFKKTVDEKLLNGSTEQIERIGETIRAYTKELDEYAKSVPGQEENEIVIEAAYKYTHSYNDYYYDASAWRRMANDYFELAKTEQNPGEALRQKYINEKNFVMKGLYAELISKRNGRNMVTLMNDVMNETTTISVKTDEELHPGNFAVYTLNSGGAEGGDTFWDIIGKKFGLLTSVHFIGMNDEIASQELKSNGTKGQRITEQQFKEGWNAYLRANRTLNRTLVKGAYQTNLMARNYQQVVNSDAIFAISHIVYPGEIVTSKGIDYTNNALQDSVAGGTGYAVQMAIDLGKPVYVFDQKVEKWFQWNYGSKQFTPIDTPVLTANFAGIGTRQLNTAGKKAIENVYKKTIETINKNNFKEDAQGSEMYVIKTKLGQYGVIVKDGKIVMVPDKLGNFKGKDFQELQNAVEKNGGTITLDGAVLPAKQVEQTTENKIATSNYTRKEVENNPGTAYVFTENAHSITAFPNRAGGGSAIIRGLKNAFAIVTKKKYDYNTKENVDYSDTDADFKEFKRINTKLIQDLKNSGMPIVFPKGFATDKAKMPTRFAQWLQTELRNNFGLVTGLNPTETGLISFSIEKPVQQNQQTKQVAKQVSEQKVVQNNKSILDLRSKPIKYTKGQINALLDIEKLIDLNKQAYYLLSGFAGTGKTTLIENISNYSVLSGRKVLALAPTNKAVSVLKDKLKNNQSEVELKTVHSALYGEPTENLKWIPSKIISDSLIIIDESSMIDKDLMYDLINATKNNNIIIFIGDSFQLEQVGDSSGLFTSDNDLLKNNYGISLNGTTQLTEVKRQFLESNILKIATIIRSFKKSFIPEKSLNDFEVLDNNKIFINKFIKSLLFDENSVMIVSSNNLRLKISEFVRKQLSFYGILNEGETLISVSNSNVYSNSEIFKIKNINSISSNDYNIKFDTENNKNTYLLSIYNVTSQDNKNFILFLIPKLDKPSLYHKEIFNAIKDTNLELYKRLQIQGLITNINGEERLSKKIVIATYGYIITGHKSQGSEWDKVFINQNFIENSERNVKWFYTAITRAIKDVIIYKTKNNIEISEKEINDKINELSITEQAEQTTENKNDEIYSKLGSKTQSENVVIKSWYELKDAVKDITNEGIIATRIKNSNEHFGNPFSHEPAGKTYGLIKTETIREAVEKYTDWVINSQDNRAKWIREQLKSGNLKGKSILYYKELGEPSHATALDYLINKYDWNNIKDQPKQTVPEKPKVEGINISSNTKGLGGALTNMTELAKKKGNIKNDPNKEFAYPVTFKGKVYPDSEDAYQKNKTIGDPMVTAPANKALMIEIITEKLKQHPQLYDAITKNGGIEFLLNSRHNVREDYDSRPDNHWVTKNGKQGTFMEALTEAYRNVTDEHQASSGDIIARQAIDNDLKIENNNIREGVDFIFKQNPELANAVYEALGFTTLSSLSNEDNEKVNKIFKKYPDLAKLFNNNKELYNSYLESIFPNSSKEFKGELFFHGTKNPIEGGKFKISDKNLAKGLWFTKQLGYAKRIQNYKNEGDTPITYGVVLNISNPKHFYNSSGALLVQRPSDFENQYDRKNNDAAVFHHPESSDGKFTNQGGYNQIVVFDENQVHIIGDENDINKAKEFLANQLTTQQKQQAQQLYSQYLDTIFPDSKVKDIVYRGSERGIENDNRPYLYFTNNKNEATIYAKTNFTKGGNINERNPIPSISKNIGEYIDNKYGKNSFKSLNADKQDFYEQVSENDYELRLPEWYKEVELSNEDKSLLKDFKDLKQMYDIVKIESEEDLMKQYDDTDYQNTKPKYDKLRNKLNPFFNQKQIGKIEPVILNIQNPYTEEIVQEDLQNNRDAYKNGHDGAFLMDGDHFVVKRSSEQIHILGSKQDIQGFKEFIDNSNKIKYQTESGNEMLASENPKVQQFILKHFKKLFPSLKVFDNIEDFIDFVNDLGGDITQVKINSLGAAFGNAVYINPDTAVQSTFFHENAHIYWKLLPDDNSVKQKLIELFGNEEDAVLAIGRAGYAYASKQMEYEDAGLFKKFQILLKEFWNEIKGMFPGTKGSNPVLEMAKMIWQDKSGLFTQEEKIAFTIEHMVDPNDIVFDEAEHKYTTKDGTIELTSATTLVKNIQVEPFNAEKKAANIIAQENIKRFNEGIGTYTMEQRAERTNEILNEWKAAAQRGTDGHAFIRAYREGKEIPESVLQHFTPEAIEQFKQEIDAYFAANGHNPETEIFEEVIFDPENLVAGTKDLSVMEDTGMHIIDFKFSEKSKYNEDGTLTDEYTKPYGGRKFKKPFANMDDSKLNHHTIQLNIYGKIIKNTTGNLPYRYSIFPVNYELNKDGKISSIKFEPRISISYGKGDSIDRLFAYNKAITTEEIEMAADSAKERKHIDNTALKIEIEAIKYLKSLLPQDVQLKDLYHNPNYLIQIFAKAQQGVIDSMKSALGFTDADIIKLDLHTLLWHWIEHEQRPNMEDLAVYEKAWPTVTQYENKHGNLPQDLKDKFERDLKKVKEIYKEIGTIAKLEAMTNEDLFEIYKQLDAMDEMAAGPLMFYIQQRLYMFTVAKQVGEENRPGFKSYRHATILLAELSKLPIYSHSESTWIAYMTMNHRTISQHHKRVQFFFKKIRIAKDKAFQDGLDMEDDIDKYFKNKDFNIDNVVFEQNGTYYFKAPYSDLKGLNDIEKEFISYIYDFHSRYDSYHNYSKAKYGVEPYVAAPMYAKKNNILTWLTNPANARRRHYFQPQVFDNEIVTWKGQRVSFDAAKQDFNFETDKMKDLINAYNEAKDSFERKPKYIKKRRSSIPIINNPRGKVIRIPIKFNERAYKSVLKSNMNSIINKHYVEPMIPIYRFTEKFYEIGGDAVKWITNMVHDYGEVQIFGNTGETNHVVDHIAQFFMSVVAMKSLYLNWRAQLINLFIGLYNNTIFMSMPDATGWQVFSPMPFVNGVLRTFTSPMKTFNLMKRYQVVDVASEHEIDSVQYAQVLFNKVSMILTVIAEDIIHGVGFAGQMTKEQWNAHDSKGRLLPGMKSKFTTGDLSLIENQVDSSQGDYGKRNTRFVNYNTTGKLFSQFRNWMFSYFGARFGAAYIDANGVKQQGHFSSGVKYMLALLYNNLTTESYKHKMFAKYKHSENPDLNVEYAYRKFHDMTDEELLGTLKLMIREAEGGRIKFKELSPSTQQQIGRFIKEVTLMMVVAAINSMWFRDDDDDKKKKKKKADDEYIPSPFMKALMQQLTGDVMLATPYGNMDYTFKTPLPALGWVFNAYTTVQLMSGAAVGDKSAFYKGNSKYGKDGEPKFWNSLIRIAPFGSGIYGTRILLQENALENKKNKKPTLNLNTK